MSRTYRAQTAGIIVESNGPHAPFDIAQDGPFDVAQDGPFDVAQDGPFDVAQDRLGGQAPRGWAWGAAAPGAADRLTDPCQYRPAAERHRGSSQRPTRRSRKLAQSHRDAENGCGRPSFLRGFVALREIISRMEDLRRCRGVGAASDSGVVADRKRVIISVMPFGHSGLEDIRRSPQSLPSLLIAAISLGFAYPATITARKPPAG